MKSGYGYEKILLDYADLPSSFPFLPCYDHGLSFEEIPNRNSTLNHLSDTYLCWGERIYENIAKKTNKKPVIIGAPFLIYKNKNNILKKTQKKTLFFISHSTDKISQNVGPKEIDEMVSKIDNCYKPIDLCLHWSDYLKEKDTYEKMGYNVFTAGKVFNNSFVKNFYDIITNYEFTMSNKLGTYILFSLDLGIPFSLIGQEPVYFNHSNDKNKPKSYKITDYEYGRRTVKLFYGLNNKISEDQKNFSILESGKNNIINKEQLCKILKNEFLDSFHSKRGIKSLSKNIAKSFYLQIFK